LQQPGTESRIAACWYSGSSFTIDVNLTDGQTHQVALYALDWDSYGPRQEQIRVIDPSTGNVLDSETVSNFSGGQYLVYNVTGHVQFQITNLVGGSNGVIGGLFFGGRAASANPTGLTATAGNGQVALSWSAASGAASYNLYRGGASGGETLVASGISGTSFTDSGLNNGSTYFYEVTAVNIAGEESGGSNEASATPQAPSSLLSATALTSSANPSVYGQTITLTATVTAASGSGTPTGNVLFMDGNNALGSASLNSSGVATLNVSLATGGSSPLTAYYSGDSNFAGSSSATLSQTVKNAASSVALASTSSTAVFGQAVTFTATLSAVSPGSGTPTGTVTFYNGSTLLGGAALNNGVASFTTSGLSAGSHTIKASYGGDGNFISCSKSISQSVKKDSVKLTASPTTATRNQAVTLTATVTVASPGSGLPTGTVTYKDATKGVVLGIVPLVNGTATLPNVVFTSSGKHRIAISYSGDPDDLASSMTVVIAVAI
jgi:hypothetical protein